MDARGMKYRVAFTYRESVYCRLDNLFASREWKKKHRYSSVLSSDTQVVPDLPTFEGASWQVPLCFPRQLRLL